MKKRLYRNDLILNLIVILACVAIPVLVFFSSNETSKAVIVSVDGQAVQELSLSDNISVVEGGVTVEVKDGRAYVAHSDCPDGLCMKMKPCENVGDSIICVPNRVTVRVVGKMTETEADVVAG